MDDEGKPTLTSHAWMTGPWQNTIRMCLTLFGRCVTAEEQVDQLQQTLSSAGLASVAGHAGRDSAMSERQRQGFRVDKMSSSDQLDVTVYNLLNLA